MREVTIRVLEWALLMLSEPEVIEPERLVARIQPRGRARLPPYYKARVTVLLEVDVTDTWGEDTTMGQIRIQAMRAAQHRVKSIKLPERVKVLGYIDTSIDYRLRV